MDCDIVNYRSGVEKCEEWSENTTQQIDLAFNIFFMVYFFIRVSNKVNTKVVTTNKKSFMIRLYYNFTVYGSFR